MPGPLSSTSMRTHWPSAAARMIDLVAEAHRVGDEVGDRALEGLPLQGQHDVLRAASCSFSSIGVP